MNIIQVKFSPWDKAYNFDSNDLKLKKGDWVLVHTEIGTEIAQVTNTNPKTIEPELLKDDKGNPLPVKPVLRKANLTDMEKIQQKSEQRQEAFDHCRKIIKKLSLPMKLFDARFSYDGGRITFAYIAPERVDFRELVKDLTHKFQKSIRMQQVGVREEARLFCNIGLCGREACCRKFLENLGNITLDQAYLQQVAHRGSERISGVCGRLLCCLQYEQPMYEACSQKLPPIGSEVKTPKGKGKVIAWHILKQTVDVRLDKQGEGIIELAIEE
ncbi:stage 0 sporulation protein [Candidatus Falkowbacteria bacterium]|nr:stage 0 sporulation protein [Candidatus Falkowbacteria bacterium]